MKRVLDSCLKAVNGSGTTHSLVSVNEISKATRAKSQSDVTGDEEILNLDDYSIVTKRKKRRLGPENEVIRPGPERSPPSQGSEDISKATREVGVERHPSATFNLSVIHGPSDISLSHVQAEGQFPYKSLDTSKLEIRVITLHPGIQTDEIYCSLTHIATNKGSKPNYKALSYTWGSPESPKTIFLNGVRVQVREYLLPFKI